jgi:hypothetical protein
MNAPDVLDSDFLELRAKVLQVAASLDRMARASGSVEGDPRLALLIEAIDVLKSRGDDRAEQIQLIFSRPYDDQWQDNFFPLQR